VAGVTDPFTARAVSEDGTTAYATVTYKVKSSEVTDASRRALEKAADQARSNDEIAEQLFLSVLTVRSHIQRALTELGARDRARLVVIAYQTGLVRPASPRP
jgi:DNA-binding NarL/FixJ family response regulator